MTRKKQTRVRKQMNRSRRARRRRGFALKKRTLPRFSAFDWETVQITFGSTRITGFAPVALEYHFSYDPT